MRQVLKVLMLLIYTGVQSQTIDKSTYQNQLDKYKGNIDCGEGTQQEINICLGNSIQNLEKVLNEKYRCLTLSIETTLRNNTSTDKARASELKKIKKAIIVSQEAFEELRKRNTDFYLSYYDNGTELPMYLGLSQLQDIQDRLRRLDDFLETLKQGDLISCN